LLDKTNNGIILMSRALLIKQVLHERSAGRPVLRLFYLHAKKMDLNVLEDSVWRQRSLKEDNDKWDF